MYRIKLSDNMIRQGFIPPRESFKTGREAYEHGIAKWGSGTYNDKIHGWYIEEEEKDDIVKKIEEAIKKEVIKISPNDMNEIREAVERAERRRKRRARGKQVVETWIKLETDKWEYTQKIRVED